VDLEAAGSSPTGGHQRPAPHTRAGHADVEADSSPGPVGTSSPLQRRSPARAAVVLEGRDTGSVVCPEAEVKFYLDADLDERAKRRARSWPPPAFPPTKNGKAEVTQRDRQDMEVDLAPLVRPEAPSCSIDRALSGSGRGANAGRGGAGAMLYKILSPLPWRLVRWRLGLQVRGAEHVPGSVRCCGLETTERARPPVIGSSTSRTPAFMARPSCSGFPASGADPESQRASVRRGIGPEGAQDGRPPCSRGRALLAFPRAREAVTARSAGQAGIGMLAVLRGARGSGLCDGNIARAAQGSLVASSL